MTFRLLSALSQHWETFDGFAVAYGAGDLKSLPVERACNFVYWYLTRESDEKSLDKFKSQLWMPPAGTEVNDPRSPWSPENETAALASFQATMTGTAPQNIKMQ